MIAVTGEAHGVVEAGGTEVLQHRAGGNHTVETAGFHGCLALGGDNCPHLTRVGERLGPALRLAQVVISLRENIVEFRRAAVCLLCGLHLIHKPLDCRLFGLCPSPGKLASGVLLNGDDVPFTGCGNCSQALSGYVGPAGLAGIANVAVIIRSGAPAVVIFGDSASSIVHMDHLDLVESGCGENAGQVLYSVFGETVSDEEDTEVRLDVKLGIGGSRDVDGDVRDSAFAA